MRRDLLLLFALSACTPGGSEAPKHASAAGLANAAAARRSGPPDARAHATPPCTPDGRKEKPSASLEARSKAVAALSKGKLADAAEALQDALSRRPGDLAAFTLATATTADRNALRAELTKSTAMIKPVDVGAVGPPLKTHARVDKLPKVGSVSLKRVGEERHDGDWSSWLTRTGMENAFAAPPGQDDTVEFPSEIGELFMGTVLHHKGHTVVRYGPALLMIGAEGEGLRSVNFLPALAEGFKAVLKPPSGPASPGSPPPPPVDPMAIMAEVRYSRVIGPLLVAELAHEGDAIAAKPDGFLVAFDLTTDKVAWVSDAGIANAQTFHAGGGYVVTAFGTAQAWTPAYGQKPAAPSDAKLSVVDLSTGKVVASAPLQTRADYIHGDGKRIYAWSYETIETFEISESAAVPAPQLGALTRVETKLAAMPTDPNAGCWLRNAVVALDHRDGNAVLTAASAFPEDASLTKALRAAGEFLVERASGRPGIDLSEVEPTPVAPSAAKVRTDGAKKTVPARRFAATKDEDLLYPSGGPALEKSSKGGKAAKDAAVEFPLPIYPGHRTDLYPTVYGSESIYWAAKEGDDVYLAYGQRYVAVVKKDAVTKIYDFESFVGPGAKPAAGYYRPLAYTGFFDGTLLVVTNPPTYDPKSSSAFVAVLDPTDGKTLWRSEAGVLARQPVVFQDFVVVAANRNGAGELVALRRHDGQVATKISFAEPVSDFGWDGRGAFFVTLPKDRKYFTFR